MSSKLSEFVNLSPLAAALEVLLGRVPVPARYLDGALIDERVEPRLDENSAAAASIGDDARVLPYIADEAPGDGFSGGADHRG